MNQFCRLFQFPDGYKKYGVEVQLAYELKMNVVYSRLCMNSSGSVHIREKPK